MAISHEMHVVEKRVKLPVQNSNSIGLVSFKGKVSLNFKGNIRVLYDSMLSQIFFPSMFSVIG